MKKIISLIAVCLLTLSASAQIVSSSSRSITRENAVYPNYQRIYLSYNSMKFSSEGESSDESLDGFRVGWLEGWNISKSMPLYIEAGFNAQYNHWSESVSSRNYSEDRSITMLRINVPVNLAYRFTIPNTSVVIAPHAGLHLSANIVGQNKVESDGKSETASHFDKDDMGSSDATAKRVQVGAQVGVGVIFKKFYVGFEYCPSLSDYQKKVKTPSWNATIGLEF